MKFRTLAFAITLLHATVSAAANDSLAKGLQAIDQGRFTEAVSLLRPVSDAGDPVAQLKLGLLYYYGRGVRENEKTAVELLTKSANQGNVEAMYHLGNAFAFGADTAGLAADADQEAAKWFFKAASAGNADAQYSLGLLFVTGKGVQKSDEEASYWMQQAAKNGHKEAQGYITGKAGK